MTCWKQTYSGIAWDLEHPDPSDVRIADIAHALSQICRYSGHTRAFYSVASHSVHASDLARMTHPQSPEIWWHALLHDAHEAYIGDLISPVKVVLRQGSRGDVWDAFEDQHALAVSRAFGVDTSHARKVKVVDLQCLADERDALLGPSPRVWGCPDLPASGLPVRPIDPLASRSLFMRRFNEIRRLIRDLRGADPCLESV